MEIARVCERTECIRRIECIFFRVRGTFAPAHCSVSVVPQRSRFHPFVALVAQSRITGLPISPAGRGELQFVGSIVAIYSIHIIIRMWFAFKLKFIVEDFLLYGSNDDVEHMHVVP